MSILDSIEREHEARSKDLTRVLSAAAYTPDHHHDQQQQTMSDDAVHTYRIHGDHPSGWIGRGRTTWTLDVDEWDDLLQTVRGLRRLGNRVTSVDRVAK